MSHLRLLGCDPASDLVVVSPENGNTFLPGELAPRLSPDIAIALLPSVIFTTGQLLPLTELVDVAEQNDILLMSDCSHSMGCVPHDFHRDRLPLAFWDRRQYLEVSETRALVT